MQEHGGKWQLIIETTTVYLALVLALALTLALPLALDLTLTLTKALKGRSVSAVRSRYFRQQHHEQHEQ